MLLHALGKAPQRRGLVQPEHIAQRRVALCVKARVHRAKKGREFPERSAAKHTEVVRNIADAALDGRIFIDRQTADGHAAGIRAENTDNVADGGGFSCAV